MRISCVFPIWSTSGYSTLRMKRQFLQLSFGPSVMAKSWKWDVNKSNDSGKSRWIFKIKNKCIVLTANFCSLCLLHLTSGNCCKLHSRHWLLLHIVQLIQAFASIHHLPDWCRNCCINAAIASCARNPFLRRYHLNHQQTSQTYLQVSSNSSYLFLLGMLNSFFSKFELRF